MAANSQNTRGLVGLGKRFVNQIRVGSSSDPARSPSLPFRRAVHASVYDKNVDDQVRPTVVPDDLIQPESDKYWAPDPKTGVFGPAAEHKPSSAGIKEPAGRHSVVNGVGSDSVLEQKTFFRPLEDLEKPTEDSGINPPQL
ncbi:late embryogenesis abundant protein At5g17165 [Diospyros lotus]|uniref:late embryogenesis abundant protein At5g17165 n=1 Tax=Diospyros lotus TaxID=55363 RepID=UPI002256A78D|nr:late embryogenesis abundant protein At5g17165 [Diospyros lotus]